MSSFFALWLLQNSGYRPMTALQPLVDIWLEVSVRRSPYSAFLHQLSPSTCIFFHFSTFPSLTFLLIFFLDFLAFLGLPLYFHLKRGMVVTSILYVTYSLQTTTLPKHFFLYAFTIKYNIKSDIFRREKWWNIKMSHWYLEL